jgi:peptide chain release factor 1
MNATQQIEHQLKEIEANIKATAELAKDPEMAELAQAELKSLQSQKQALEASIDTINGTVKKSTGVTNDHMDANNAILEVRAGTGGDEAKLFAEDLLRMYVKFASDNGFKIESLDDGVIKIKKKNAYGTFKYESGVHRVQRVPATESQGRIHTSTASVAVLPEVPPTGIEVKEEDLDWKFTRAGGHGGQNVNKVNTAVMLTHKPTGLVVHCRQERSQQQNRFLALEILRGKLWEIEEEKRLSNLKQKRQIAVGRAMRAEKIRTYNYPENRVTDHRIKKTWKSLDTIIEGDLTKIIQSLQAS